MTRMRLILTLVALAGLSARSCAQTVTLGEPQFSAPAVPAIEPRFPINLATALKLAGAQPLTIALAEQRVQAAAAQLDRAKALWLPSLILGGDYARHDGQIQDVGGTIFATSKSSLYAGGGAALVVSLSDAWFEPLAARQRLSAQRAGAQAARNDAVLDVGEAYFNVQQARGDLLGANDTLARAEELVRRTERLSPGLIAPVEVSRAKAELARRRQAVLLARERWAVASADLARVLRLDADVLVEPNEPPSLQVSFVPLDRTAAESVALAFAHRPELDQSRALLEASRDRVRQEQARPLIPSLLVRGNGTNPSGTLGAGVFGGGRNNALHDFAARSDWDAQVVWELQNLGLGNRARVHERRAENQAANLDLQRTHDIIAAEVVKALAQATFAGRRIADAEQGLKDALDSAEKNFEGLSQTRRLGGEVSLLVVRPQEAVAAIQALHQAYADYFAAINDYDRAQFRLYRAIGMPGCPGGEPIAHHAK